MKVYAFGAENAPVIMLLPGTCCHWKSNFEKVISLLADTFRVLCVSYDGFDETEHTEFPTMTQEVEKLSTISRSIAADSFVQPTAAHWAALLWGCWPHGKTSIWTTESSAALIWTRPLPLRPSCRLICFCR